MLYAATPLVAVAQADPVDPDRGSLSVDAGFALRVVAHPWQNPANPYDVDGSGPTLRSPSCSLTSASSRARQLSSI